MPSASEAPASRTGSRPGSRPGSRSPWYLRRLVAAYDERQFTPPPAKKHRNPGPGSYDPTITISRPRTIGGVIANKPGSTAEPRPVPATVDLQLRPFASTASLSRPPPPAASGKAAKPRPPLAQSSDQEYELTVIPPTLERRNLKIYKIQDNYFFGSQRWRSGVDLADLEHILVQKHAPFVEPFVKKKLHDVVNNVLFMIDHQ